MRSLDAVEQAVAGRIIGAVQRLLEGERVGRAVALEHQAAQAQQRGAVVAAVVDAVLEAVAAPAARPAPPAWSTALRVNSCLMKLVEHRRQPFGGLQHDVADEAVADDDVGRALEDVVAFDVAVEVEMPAGGRRAQQLAGLLDRLAALDRLLADVEQARPSGSSLPSTAPTRALPITANCSRCSAVQSTLAPRSSTVVKPSRSLGITVAIAGRSMPSTVFST